MHPAIGTMPSAQRPRTSGARLVLERSCIFRALALGVNDRPAPPALAARLVMIRDSFAPVDDIAVRILGNDAAGLANRFRVEVYGQE